MLDLLAQFNYNESMIRGGRGRITIAETADAETAREYFAELSAADTINGAPELPHTEI